MRTTVTLDPDVERLLRDAMHRNRESFKASLNQALRRGLAGHRSVGPPILIEARSMGLRAGIDPARFNQLADQLESEALVARMRMAEAAERRRQARRQARSANSGR